ncbi:MAG TPA: hypothetical protein PL155_04235 [Candidatus Omnitrophota bacterium]|nr:hypothetical protein [Candidatus Omnitrophota bacterium]HRZ03174.1 hypothetical protein [Candidatus Omnitrophota bacterium]
MSLGRYPLASWAKSGADLADDRWWKAKFAFYFYVSGFSTPYVRYKFWIKIMIYGSFNDTFKI